MAREMDSQVHTKSGIMLGLGETEIEVPEALRDLREAGCDIVTIGQYLQPTLRHLPVFGVFGDGQYRLQPMHVDDFAALAVE